MVVEIELKLRIVPEQLARLKRHALIKSLSGTRSTTRRLYNIYYDTPKLELHKSGMALRLRHVRQQWLQTLKGGGSVRSGLHQRNEWEVPVSGPALDFSFLSEESGMEEAMWDEHLPLSLRKKLQPVFVTDFYRNSRMLNFQGAQIELCMDQGEISTEKLSMPFCELELELISGDPQKLFELGLAILEIVPFELELVSKAEQGYRLLSGYNEHPVKAAVPTLVQKDKLADALQTLIWSCLQHFQNNLHGVMSGDNAEYLHQMRVALRRLRVVLRMTEKVHADQHLAELKNDISALCVSLARAREWDVFIALTLQPLCKPKPKHAGLQALLAASERQRAECYAALRSAAQAREVQRLLLCFAIWMNGEYWHQQALIMLPVQEFVCRRLDKLTERFAHSVQHLNNFDPARLHALRILAKKLRYSAEFFASLYDKQDAKPFLAALNEVQEELGQINDVTVAHRLLDELAAADALAIHQDAVALSKGWIAHDLSLLLTALRSSMQNFDKQQLFWRK